ncbi:MAG: AbrB/MazE/SpoVT family DNA-binding domain-containing protein [Nanoarchaeota archaeon]
MSKRKFDAKLRKVGNSYVVTIPSETIERFELNEGDFLAVELNSDEIKKINKIKKEKK